MKHYLVCYAIDGGALGDCEIGSPTPLSWKVLTEWRSMIEKMDSVGGKKVVFTNIIEIQPVTL